MGWQHERSVMSKIVIGFVMIILATSYLVQRERIIERVNAMLERERVVAVAETEKPKVEKPKQTEQPQVELLPYPAPGDQPISPYPYAPPTEWQPTIITPDLGPLPTPAPTFDPWSD